MKKTNYRKSLEKMFPKQESKKILETNPDTGELKAEPVPINTYKLSQTTPYEFLTYTETPYTRSQKDIRILDKMENELIDAGTITTKDKKKISIKVPRRLKHLTKEPEDV